MRWIGLTGSIGSGKSSVAELLVAHGFPVIDADQLARSMVAPGTLGEEKVVRTFGQSILGSDGHLDRKKLAELVFNDQEKLRQLEQIVHPLVQAEVKIKREQLAAEGHRFAFYDVPLLYEKQLESQFDAVVVVYADVETCIDRVMIRNRWTRAEAMARLRNQLMIEEKIKKAHWMVDNSGSKLDLVQEVEELIQDIGRKFP